MQSQPLKCTKKMTTKNTAWEIVAISSGKREQVCDSLEHARTLCTLMQIEGRDRYKIQEVTHYETHEQELYGRKT